MLAALQTLAVLAVLAGAAPADTARESAPAPLLVPGRPGPVDSTRLSREARAREQYRKGLDLERVRAYVSAMTAYRLALHDDPKLAGPNYHMGGLFLQAGQVEEAVKAFAAEVEQHPGDARAARELGLGWSQLDEHRRAIAQLELLTRRLPNDGENWRALGYAYMRARRPREAEAALRRAIALPPESALEHRDLGYVLAATGRENEARAEYRRAIALDPKESGAWVNLANLERAGGDLQRALADFREAERRDSTLVLALVGQAQALAGLQRIEEAGATWRRLLAISPGDLEARFNAVRIYERLGRDDIALELARDGVRRDSESSGARLLLGMALEAQGRLREAARELRRAEATAPDTAGGARARGLLDTLRRETPDSLRALIAADSVAFAQAQAQAPRRGRREPGRPRPVMAVPPERTDSLFLPARPDTR